MLEISLFVKICIIGTSFYRNFSKCSIYKDQSNSQGAQKGHSLLKKKSDALTMKFRATLKKIIENKTVMGDVMKAVYFSLAESTYAAGDIS